MEAGPGVVHGCCGVVADAHDDVDAAVASRRLDASWRLAHDDRYRSINQSMSQYGTPPSSLVVVTVAGTRECWMDGDASSSRQPSNSDLERRRRGRCCCLPRSLSRLSVGLSIDPSIWLVDSTSGLAS